MEPNNQSVESPQINNVIPDISNTEPVSTSESPYTETSKRQLLISWLHVGTWVFIALPLWAALATTLNNVFNGYSTSETLHRMAQPIFRYQHYFLILGALFTGIILISRIRDCIYSTSKKTLILPLLLACVLGGESWLSGNIMVGLPGNISVPGISSEATATLAEPGQKIVESSPLQVATSSYRDSTEMTSIYRKDNDGIYYIGDGAEGPSNKVYLQGVDSNTFTNVSVTYAKDKNNVYYYADKVIGADPTTFEVFLGQPSEVFAKDNTSVYFRGDILKGADTSTFRILNEPYAKDKNRVYVYGVPSENMDAATFEVFSSSAFTKDKQHVYYAGVIFPSIDPATFDVLSLGYSKDKNHAYWNNKVIEGADVATFRVVGRDNATFYAKDKNNVYQADVIKQGSNPNTFIIQ